LVPSTVKLLYRKNKWGSRGLQAWPETGSWWELVRNRAGNGTSGIDNFAWQHNWQNEHEAWEQVPSRMLTFWESRLCSLKGSRFGPLKIRFGQLLTYNKANGWTAPFRNGSWQCWKECRESETPCLHGVSLTHKRGLEPLQFNCFCAAMRLYNSLTKSNSQLPNEKGLTCRHAAAHDPMIAGQPVPFCHGRSDTIVYLPTKLQNCEPIDLSRFVVDLRERHMEYKTPHSETHPREHNSNRSTYHQWCALPTRRELITHSPYILPKYMLLNLPRDVIRSAARFRLCVHTLRFETATGIKVIPPPVWPVWYW